MTSLSKCEQCGIQYYPTPGVPWQKFCSRQCRDAKNNAAASDLRRTNAAEIERLEKALRHAAGIISAGKQHPDATYEWLLIESAK